ncbi:MAG: (2Fe-2S) ferredoxin domain-containing protein [Prochlorococcaceae cyanobacterium]|jgi:(2Fe-2S) ferredoxin
MPRPSAEAGLLRVRRHLLLCATPSRPVCHDDGTGAASWERLKALLRTHGLEDPDHPAGAVLRSKVDCLRLCQGGPVLLVWPEGIWYGGVTPERVERIVVDHLLGGCPVEDWIVRRTPLARPSGIA